MGGAPSVSGTFNVTFTASNGVGGGATQSFSLVVSGGGPVAALSPTSVDFGDVPLHHVVSNRLVLQNTGSSPLSISRIWLTPGANTDWDDFFIVSLCGRSLAAGKSCPIYVLYFADDLGTHVATLSVTDDSPGGTQTASLKGTAVRTHH